LLCCDVWNGGRQGARVRRNRRRQEARRKQRPAGHGEPASLPAIRCCVGSGTWQAIAEVDSRWRRPCERRDPYARPLIRRRICVRRFFVRNNIRFVWVMGPALAGTTHSKQRKHATGETKNPKMTRVSVQAPSDNNQRIASELRPKPASTHQRPGGPFQTRVTASNLGVFGDVAC